MQNERYRGLLNEKYCEFPFISEVPQYGDGDVKKYFLVWQTKKYEWLNFTILF